MGRDFSAVLYTKLNYLNSTKLFTPQYSKKYKVTILNPQFFMKTCILLLQLKY